VRAGGQQAGASPCQGSRYTVVLFPQLWPPNMLRVRGPVLARLAAREMGAGMTEWHYRSAPQCAMVQTVSLKGLSSRSGPSDRGRSGSFLVHGCRHLCSPGSPQGPTPFVGFFLFASCRLPLPQTATASNHRARHLPARGLLEIAAPFFGRLPGPNA
jgi:hypothetical protein